MIVQFHESRNRHMEKPLHIDLLIVVSEQLVDLDQFIFVVTLYFVFAINLSNFQINIISSLCNLI